jgi:hypothetical protein
MPFSFYSPPQAREPNPAAKAFRDALEAYQQFAYKHPSMEEAIKQARLANQFKEAELPYAGQLAKSSAAYKEAMAQYLSNPYQIQRFMTPTGKLLNERNILGGEQPVPGSNGYAPGQVPNENADIYNREIQKVTTDPGQRAAANSAQIIYNQVNDIDTKPLEKFAGLGGHIQKALEQGKGVLSSFGIGKGPSEDYRKYNAYMSVHKNAIMDAIRAALKTSVVPGYVQATLQPMVDPSSPIWNDPEQVKKNLDTLKEWTKGYAQEQTQTLKKGVPETLEESMKRHVSKSNKSDNLEGKEGFVIMIGPDGSRAYVPNNKVNAALKGGASYAND